MHTFLSHCPPFDALPEDELRAVVDASEEVVYPDGGIVLVEDGPPAEYFYVVREGAADLLHEGEVVDTLEPGEGFGHPSLLTGLGPSFTVRAVEGTRLVLVPKQQALEVLRRPAGAGFVARTLRDRLTRAGHTVHGLPELRTVHVGSLVDRRTPFLGPEASIREAALRMTECSSTAALVRLRDGLGIVTDADLRARVVAAGVSPDDPVAMVMSTPVLTVRPEQVALEAMLDMLARGHDHVAVVDARGGVLGTVGAAELVALESRGPFGVRRALLAAADVDGLVEAWRRLPLAFVALLDAGLPPQDVGRLLSLAADALTQRLLELASAGLGPAPAPWAWLALGSGARGELTLGSDQDNALAYGDTDDPAAPAYFAALAEAVNDGLARCGFGGDQAGVLARDPRWRKTESGWLATFEDCLVRPDRSGLVRAAIAFDFRHVSGGLPIVGPLVAVLQRARQHPDFLRALARTATDWRPPLGFRGGLVLERDGTGTGRFDVKRGGTLPIANLARFHALAHGITISSTLDRLVAAEELGALEPERAQALREAFVIVWRVRLEHHAAQIQAEHQPDNLVDPNDLPPLARRELLEAFRTVAQAQKQLSIYVPMGR